MNNTNEKEIDRLTHNLMRGTAEQPSPSLNARIMALIMAEKKEAFKYHIRRLPVGGVIFAFFVVYMLLLSGVLYFYSHSDSVGLLLPEMLERYFPLILTVGAGFSFCYFFAELDKWLRRRSVLSASVGEAE